MFRAGDLSAPVARVTCSGVRSAPCYARGRCTCRCRRARRRCFPLPLRPRYDGTRRKALCSVQETRFGSTRRVTRSSCRDGRSPGQQGAYGSLCREVADLTMTKGPKDQRTKGPKDQRTKGHIRTFQFDYELPKTFYKLVCDTFFLRPSKGMGFGGRWPRGEARSFTPMIEQIV